MATQPKITADPRGEAGKLHDQVNATERDPLDDAPDEMASGLGPRFFNMSSADVGIAGQHGLVLIPMTEAHAPKRSKLGGLMEFDAIMCAVTHDGRLVNPERVCVGPGPRSPLPTLLKPLRPLRGKQVQIRNEGFGNVRVNVAAFPWADGHKEQAVALGLVLA